MSETKPYDGAGWIARVKPNSECARGCRPKDLGTEVAGKAASRKITSGRKSFRGMASDDLQRAYNRERA